MNSTIIIVTGASSGIGKAVCKKLFENGKCVLGISRNNIHTESNNSYYLKCNLEDSSDIDNLFQYCKDNQFTLAGIIHCAGLCTVQQFDDIDRNDAYKTYNVNVFALIELCKKLKNYKNRSKDTRVIACSSITAERAYPSQLLYASSKAALNNVIYGLSNMGIQEGIKVNGIEFGAVNTEMFQSLKPGKDVEKRHYPLGILEADEAAQIIIDLLSPEFIKMTGSILRVDSGFFSVH